MNSVINIGSINIDHVYRVDHQVRPGETLAAERYELFPGGKGLNQSIALARAGAEVAHVGKVGADGLWLIEELKACGVDTTGVLKGSRPTGHAVIQVSSRGENGIVIYGGANRELDSEQVVEALNRVSTGGFLLVQNETNGIAEFIRAGFDRGLQVVFNPAPMDNDISSYPLEKVRWFIINETEGEALTGETAPDEILSVMTQRFPAAETVLTLGNKGLIYAGREGRIRIPPHPVTVVDTTAAGDTFIGYFLGALIRDVRLETALMKANAVAAICVTRLGASSSIPDLAEVRGHPALLSDSDCNA